VKRPPFRAIIKSYDQIGNRLQKNDDATARNVSIGWPAYPSLRNDGL